LDHSFREAIGAARKLISPHSPQHKVYTILIALSWAELPSSGENTEQRCPVKRRVEHSTKSICGTMGLYLHRTLLRSGTIRCASKMWRASLQQKTAPAPKVTSSFPAIYMIAFLRASFASFELVLASVAEGGSLDGWSSLAEELSSSLAKIV